MPVVEIEEVLKGAKEAIAPEAIAERLEEMLEGVEQRLQAAAKDLRRSAEDLRDSTRHSIRRHPFESVLIGMGIGIFLGVLGGRAVSRGRRRW